MLRSKPGRSEGRTATIRPVSYADSSSRAKVSASACDIGRFRSPLRCSPEYGSARFAVQAWDAEYPNTKPFARPESDKMLRFSLEALWAELCEITSSSFAWPD